MKKLLAFLLIPALLFCACGTDAPAPPAQTETAAETPATENTIAAETPAVNGKYSAYSPVVINNYLMGGVEDGRWMSNEEVLPLLGETETFKVYINGRDGGDEPGKKITAADETLLGPKFEIDMSENALLMAQSSVSPDVLAVSSDKDIFIRESVRDGDPASAENQAVLATYLAAEELSADGLSLTIKDVYKTDIEGDGTEEIIVNADNEDVAEAESYGALVFIQKMVDGAPQFITVHNTLYPGTEPDAKEITSYHDILNICDLNGDGTLDLVVKTYSDSFTIYGVFEIMAASANLKLVNGVDNIEDME